MADLGEQPEGKVLSLDPKRKEATGNGIGKLGSIVLSNRLCARSRCGGVVVITEFLTRLRFLILRKDRRELEQELEFHIEQSIASKRVAGLSAAEARRQALIEFGGIESTREQCERLRPGWWIGSVSKDVRYAFRGFRRNPLFALS